MRIIKRKKKYFYLQHSFRKDGKVITKEKYLGKEIPKNIFHLKDALQEEEKNSLYKKLERIKENFQEEWKKYPESIKKKEVEEIAIAFTYNTNAIEGSTITLEESREIIEEGMAPNKPIRDIKETEAHYKAFASMLTDKTKISAELLLNWHKEIFSETKKDIAGKFRDYLIKVGDYTAPDWQDIKKLIGQLVDFIDNTNINPVELAARAHYRFEKIHPFGDGNGRIGRLLMNKILWKNKYPMLIIEYKKRKSYYRALKRDENGFVHYFMRRYLADNKKRYL